MIINLISNIIKRNKIYCEKKEENLDEYAYLGDINKFIVCTNQKSCRCACCYYYKGKRNLYILKVLNLKYKFL